MMFNPKQSREKYFAEMQQSLEDIKNGRLISLTKAEFDALIKPLREKN